MTAQTITRPRKSTLALACSVIIGLFAWLSFDATLWPLMVAKVVQEIVGYGLLVPAQQVLFTVVREPPASASGC